jgi:hypothetical protein
MNLYSVQKTNCGQIINLISSDFNNLETTAFNIFWLYLSPINFALCFFGLYLKLGYFSVIAIFLIFMIFVL